MGLFSKLFGRGSSDDQPSAEVQAWITVAGAIAREVFGRRFATYLRAALRQSFKFASVPVIESLVARIECEIALRDSVAHSAAHRSKNEVIAQHILDAIQSLFVTAGPDMPCDPETLRNAYPRFEEGVRRIKQHLNGIHNQPKFVMR